MCVTLGCMMEVEIHTMKYIRLSDCPDGLVFHDYMGECDSITFGDNTESFVCMKYILDFLLEEGYWGNDDIYDFMMWSCDEFTSMDPDGMMRVLLA